MAVAEMNIAAATGILKSGRRRVGRPAALSDAEQGAFIIRVKAGENIGDLPREYGIAVTTGYRIAASVLRGSNAPWPQRNRAFWRNAMGHCCVWQTRFIIGIEEYNMSMCRALILTLGCSFVAGYATATELPSDVAAKYINSVAHGDFVVAYGLLASSERESIPFEWFTSCINDRPCEWGSWFYDRTAGLTDLISIQLVATSAGETSAEATFSITFPKEEPPQDLITGVHAER